MVKVINTIQMGGGPDDVHLELADGGEIIHCSQTGKSYAVPKKCRIPLLPAAGVQQIITGASIPGFIVQVPMEPYPFRDPLYYHVYWLKHGYAYLPKVGEQPIGLTRIGEL